MSIGIERVPEPLSVLKEQEEGEDNEAEANEEQDPNVTELPQKVDEFMGYINRVYFNGELDEGGKQLFKSDLAKLGNDADNFDYDDFENQEAPKRPRRKILITT